MRVRIRLLPMGHWAVEVKRWPWDFWIEETEHGRRTKDKGEAVDRAVALLAPKVEVKA